MKIMQEQHKNQLEYMSNEFEKKKLEFDEVKKKLKE